MPRKPYNGAYLRGDFDEGKEPKRYENFEQRSAARKQFPIENADPLLVDKINEVSLNPVSTLGLVLDEEGRVPSTNGVPRAFIMTRGEDGREKMTGLNEAGIKFGSVEFWKQAQLGNMFVYPAGETFPVQISLDLGSPTTPNVSVSKLIPPEEMPVPTLKQPGFFQRMLHRVNKNWASKETRNYYESLEADKENIKKFNEISEKRVRGTAEEMKTLRERESEIEIEDRQAELEARAKKAQEVHEAKRDGLKTYKNMTAPDPVFDKDVEKIGSEKKGLYSKAAFAKLQKIDAKVSDFKVGGQQISDEAYMGLVASCSMDPKNGENMFKAAQEYDPTAMQCLKDAGINTDGFMDKYPSAHMTVAYMDFLDHNSLRDGEDNQFEAAVNPGRVGAVKILQDYQNGVPGSKKNMAEAITRGIRSASKLLGTDKMTITNQMMKCGRIMNAAAELMEKDPELKDIAMKECGLKEDEYLSVRGFGAVDKADVKAAEQESKLANAAVYGGKLTAEEKKTMATDIITSRLMTTKLLNESKLNLKANKANKEQDEMILKMREEAILAGRTDAYSPERPLPPKGKLHNTQITVYHHLIADEHLTIPDTAVEIGKNGEKNYRALAEHIVEQEGFADMDAAEIDAKLSGEEYTGEGLLEKGSAAAQEIIAQKAAQKQAEKQIGAEKQNAQPEKMSVKDRAKMFEPKAPEERPAEELKVKPSEDIKQRAAMFGPQF